MNIFGLYCFFISLKDPPGIIFEDEFYQAYPYNKIVCPDIDPHKDITYDLYTRNKPLEPSPLQINNDELLKASGFNPDLPTVFFFHGFLESSRTNDSISIKNAYLQRPEEYNIILVSAKFLVGGPWYVTAVANCVAIGRYTAKFVEYLVSQGLPLSKVHLIGHSLGAHMAGNTASNIKVGRKTRLTALDPAGPLYSVIGPKYKLDITDADFIEIIHTNMNAFGSRELGHVNFYPNSGGDDGPQKGCSVQEILERRPWIVTELILCSHWRSYQFYAESVVNENAFLSTKCENWKKYLKGECDSNDKIHMGFSTSSSARGKYYLKTRDNPPFSLS